MKTNIRKYASLALFSAFLTSQCLNAEESDETEITDDQETTVTATATSIDAATTLTGTYENGIYVTGAYALTVDSTVNIGSLEDGYAISTDDSSGTGKKVSVTITSNGTLNVDGDWKYSAKCGSNSGSIPTTSLTIADEGTLNILSGTTTLWNMAKVSGTINVSTSASLVLRTACGNDSGSTGYATRPATTLTLYDGSEINFGTFDNDGIFTESTTGGTITLNASTYASGTGITVLDNDVLKGVTLATTAGDSRSTYTVHFYLNFEAVDSSYAELTGDSYRKTTGTVYAGILELNNYNTIVVDLFEKEDNDLIIIEDITFASDSSSLTDDVVTTSISFNITDFESGLLQLGGDDTRISIEVHSDSYYLVITDDDDAVHYIALSATDADGNEIDGFELDASNILYSIVVPEPSTYAMVFGLLALGFACYRKRK